MKKVYNFSVWLIASVLPVLGGGSSKLSRLIQGRSGVMDSLKAFRGSHPGRLAWFHVASLGEYEQAKPVIKTIKQRHPGCLVAVTFFSPSGFENVVNKPQAGVDFISYLPFDTSTNASKFLAIMKPELVFFVKYDLWANFIFEVKKRNIPLFLFSASMREDQIYFKSYGGFFKEIIQSFDWIFTQNQSTISLLHGIGVRHSSLAGDTRYDNVEAIKSNPRHFPELDLIFAGKPTVVVGSAWQEDMDLIIPYIRKNDRFKFIIVPHDIDPVQIEGWQQQIGKKSLKYSEINQAGTEELEVLFIDNIGMLSSLYQYAHIAYVGGAFGRGLHNILEPLAFRIPVLFGKVKKASKFPESAISRDYGCGFEVVDDLSFEAIMAGLQQEEAYAKAVKAADLLVKDNLGSAEKIMNGVDKIVKWK
ncbi:3-deoxy-D-manno-octulosonic acid transferase [Echinicola pacifica]|uniref:3-deoxy-D-manno-octulosonic acid transferase n=1 Tax=Echinicola pacifica TaxID=346377 RepID=A0A918UR45_9BACT|nr:glycosyltransferase N-terminal domain-containing protein [Echinicola pacifica]GGZ29406.1 3-deoxy-D-manno-octulosonic acid transferase [Echinicola pacifica]